jgi:lipopolysaccharide exporter
VQGTGDSGSEPHQSDQRPVVLLSCVDRLRTLSSRFRSIFGGHSQNFQSQLRRLVRANSLAYAVALLTAPVLARIYSPEAFGAFGLFFAFLSLTSGVGGMRFEAGIVSARNRAEARELAALALSSSVVLGAFVSLVFGAIITLRLFGAEAVPLWAALALFVSIILAVAYATLRYVLYFLADVRAVARGVVSQALGRSLFQIGLGLLSPTPSGLIAGETIGRGVGVGSVLFAARTILHRPLPRVRAIIATARRHYQYPLYSMPSSLSDAAVRFLPVPAIAALYGLHVAGLYMFVQRVIALPVGVFGQAVADTFHTELAVAARVRGQDLYPLFARTFRSLSAAGVLLAILLVVAGLTVFEPILGAEWAGAGLVLAIVAPITAAQIAVTPLSRAVFVLGGQRQKLGYDLIALSLAVVSVLLAAVLHLTFLSFLGFLTASQLIARAVYLLILRRMVRMWSAPAIHVS